VDLIQFSDWLASTRLSLLIQETQPAIPGIQTVHIIALSLLFAAALILALRFAGRGLAIEPLQQLASRFTRQIWLLLVVLAISGVLLIVAEPHRTVTNRMFYAKMIMLLVVILLTVWLSAVARRPQQPISGLHRLAAALTVLLWMAIMFAGRFIAYYESI
jgi:cytochrome bd-type quinol oxidase subunit 2